MTLSSPASVWLHAVLADAGEQLAVDALRLQLGAGVATEIHSTLQAWRDCLTDGPPAGVSRPLVERALQELSGERRGAPGRAALLLQEALAP